MPKKNKVSVSTEPRTYRLSSNERRAARLAEISNQQAELKREAAERRAKRAEQAAAPRPTPPGPSGPAPARDVGPGSG